MVILFSMSLWDKIELAAFYQPSGCWNSKCTTVVTASVTLGGICHSSFHRGEDWSQVWGSAGPAPPNGLQGSQPLESQVRPLPLSYRPWHLYHQTHSWEEQTLEAASMYTEGAQRASKPQASPVSLTRLTPHRRETSPSQVAGEVKPVCQTIP